MKVWWFFFRDRITRYDFDRQSISSKMARPPAGGWQSLPKIFDSLHDCSRVRWDRSSESPHARALANVKVKRTRERATWWAVRSMKDALRGSRATVLGADLACTIRKIRRKWNYANRNYTYVKLYEHCNR